MKYVKNNRSFSFSCLNMLGTSSTALNTQNLRGLYLVNSTLFFSSASAAFKFRVELYFGHGGTKYAEVIGDDPFKTGGPSFQMGDIKFGQKDAESVLASFSFLDESDLFDRLDKHLWCTPRGELSEQERAVLQLPLQRIFENAALGRLSSRDVDEVLDGANLYSFMILHTPLSNREAIAKIAKRLVSAGNGRLTFFI